MCPPFRETKTRRGFVLGPPEERSGSFAEARSCTETQRVCFGLVLYDLKYFLLALRINQSPPCSDLRGAELTVDKVMVNSLEDTLGKNQPT